MTLIDRLSKLDGPDREVDREIAKLFNMPWDYSAEWIKERDEAGNRFDVPVAFPYTASVDAAIALARSLWPDVMYRVGNHAEGYDPSLYLGEIFIPGETQRDYFTGVASSDAIALCIALLRAKEASHGE